MSDKIQENFQNFKEISEDSNVRGPISGQVYGTEHFQTIILEKNENGIPVAGKTIFKDDDFLNNLNPNFIDTQEFWKEAVENFPGEAIAGYSNNDDTETEEGFQNKLNNLTFENLHYAGGAIDCVDGLFQKKPTANFLEIGCGYGNVLNYINNNYLTANVFATDVVQLADHPNFVLTDGWEIPEDFREEKMDMVYSINVFQHLSDKQRLAYYEQIYDILEDNGQFIFGMHIITEDNKNSYLWGTQDEHGNYYTRFFNQFTRAPHIDEVYSILEDMGFSSVKRIIPYENIGVYVILKATK